MPDESTPDGAPRDPADDTPIGLPDQDLDDLLAAAADLAEDLAQDVGKTAPTAKLSDQDAAFLTSPPAKSTIDETHARLDEVEQLMAAATGQIDDAPDASEPPSTAAEGDPSQTVTPAPPSTDITAPSAAGPPEPAAGAPDPAATPPQPAQGTDTQPAPPAPSPTDPPPPSAMDDLPDLHDLMGDPEPGDPPAEPGLGDPPAPAATHSDAPAVSVSADDTADSDDLLSDLTQPDGHANLDPFGAPPPRGSGPPTQKPQTPPKAPASTTAPNPAAAAANGPLDDLTQPPAGSPIDHASEPATSANQEAHDDDNPFAAADALSASIASPEPPIAPVGAPPIPDPSPFQAELPPKRKPRRSAVMLGRLGFTASSAVVSMLELVDKPLAKVDRRLRTVAGVVAIVTLAVASMMFLWSLTR